MIKVELQNIFGNDLQVAESAWTSSLDHSKKKSRSEEDIKKLINFLADNKHSTPFESIIFRFWMKIPIQTDRQLITHRLQSTSGMSGRYRTMPNEYLDMPEDVYNISQKIEYKTKVDTLDKIGNYKGTSYNQSFDNLYESYIQTCETANHNYSHIIELSKEAEKDGKISNNEYKRLREFFRGVLPQNNMTERVSLMNLRAWANFYKLRSSPHAQPEIQEVAKQMLEQIEQSKDIKYCIEALKRNNWVI